MEERKNYMQVFEEKWKKIVETEGQLDLDKVARELADCTFIIEQYKKVLEVVTQGKVSKIFTYAEPINRVHHELFISRFRLLYDLEFITDKNGKISYEDLKQYLLWNGEY